MVFLLSPLWVPLPASCVRVRSSSAVALSPGFTYSLGDPAPGGGGGEGASPQMAGRPTHSPRAASAPEPGFVLLGHDRAEPA